MRFQMKATRVVAPKSIHIQLHQQKNTARPEEKVEKYI